MAVLEYRYGRVEGEASLSPRGALPLSDVCSQKSAVRDFEERGREQQVCSAEREAGKKGPEENPAWSFLSPIRLPLILQSPSRLSLFIASYLPPGPFRSPCALLILHVR